MRKPYFSESAETIKQQELTKRNSSVRGALPLENHLSHRCCDAQTCICLRKD